MRVRYLVLCLLLGACDRDRPPAPTAEQNEQLNEAEEMLNEEGAAPDGTAPMNSN